MSFMDCSPQTPHADYQITTDASGSWGCGAVFETQLAWSTEWIRMDIMAKELVPIVLSCAVWGPLILQKKLEFRCDNHSLVDAINKGSSKEPVVMHLLRCLWFFSAFFEVSVKASHIPGVANTAADMISRNRSTEFLSSHPHMAQAPTSIPPPLLKLVSPQKCDWTSPTFVRQKVFC